MSTAQQLPSRSALTEVIISTDAIQQLSTTLPQPHPNPIFLEPRYGKREQYVRPIWKQRFGNAQQVFTAIPLILSDLFALLGCFYATALFVRLTTSYAAHNEFFLQGIAVGVVYVGVGFLLGLFPATALSPVFELKQLVTACCISFAMMIALNHLLAELSYYEFSVAVVGGCLASCIVPIARAAVRRYCCRFRWWGERVIVIGSGGQGQAIYRFFDRARHRGLRPVGIVDPRSLQGEEHPVLEDGTIPFLGSVGDLSSLSKSTLARWGIVAPGGCGDMDMSQVLRCTSALPNIIILPSEFLLPSLWAIPRECAGVMGILVRDHLQNPFARLFKRSVDIAGGTIGLALAAPVFVAVFVWLKIVSPGPTLFSQERIGRGGKTFKMWKFRTMVANAQSILDDVLDADPELRQEWFETKKLKNDPRIIPKIGRFLRKSSLDELPQLWNVVVGEMSLVGPRPIPTYEGRLYKAFDAQYELYLRTTPGITGLWQVSGRNDTSYEQRVGLDSYYVCNWSVWLDYFILLRTARTVLMREGSY